MDVTHNVTSSGIKLLILQSGKHSRSDQDQIKTHVLRAPELSIRKLANFPAMNSFYWSGPDTGSWLGIGSLATIKSNGLSRITSQLQQLNAFHNTFSGSEGNGECPSETKPRFFGGISFHPKSQLSQPWDQFSPAHFVLPKFQVYQNNGRSWLTINQFKDESINPRSFLKKLNLFCDQQARRIYDGDREILRNRQFPRKDSWIKLANDVIEGCRGNSYDKIVLCQERRLKMDAPITTSYAVNQLENYDEECFKFLLKPHPIKLFCGVSPEKLIVKRDEVVESESLAGTTESDANEQKRKDLARKLMNDSKNRREHDLVANYIQDVMSPWVENLETVPPTVRSLPEIQHLLTRFRGSLHDDRHILEMVRDIHPTPAVGGLPIGRTRAFLRDREQVNRGFYASPVGWFDLEGDGSFCVAIRSALIAGVVTHLYAGAGLIDRSEADKEWEEIQLKYKNILRALFPKSS